MQVYEVYDSDSNITKTATNSLERRDSVKGLSALICTCTNLLRWITGWKSKGWRTWTTTCSYSHNLICKITIQKPLYYDDEIKWLKWFKPGVKEVILQALN